MSLNGEGHRGFQLQNFIRQDGKKRVKYEAVGEKRGGHEDDESKTAVRSEDVKNRLGEAVQLRDLPQMRLLQSSASMVCWERFLHLRTLKVLLVENDDSTRHVVSALLRKCSYEVIEAANGLQAWKMLEDLNIHIDLILTEVLMPCFSGIGLLCKIMNHKTRKNVPVIMMSSHDSMGLVFKCLSKGAVDFLVKPIRKNELKILWQHVWRRCHTSSCSGSESGTQTRKSVKSKSVENRGNNIGSNDEEDNGINFNIENGSDKESSTQGSWTKQVREVESTGDVPDWDQVPECADSACAQVLPSKAKAFGNDALLQTMEFQEQNKQQDLRLELSNEVPIKRVSVKQKNIVPEMVNRRFNEHLNNGYSECNSGGTTNKLKSEHAALRGQTNDTIDPQIHKPMSGAFKKRLRISDILSKAKSNLSQESSFKRLKDSEKIVQGDQNGMRPSDSTTFSSQRNLAGSKFNQASTVHVGSNFPCEVLPEIQSNSSGNPPNQCSNGDSNNVDMDSTTNNPFTKSTIINEESVVAPSVICLNISSPRLPIKEDKKISAPEQILLDSCDDVAAAMEQAQLKGIKKLCDPHDCHLHQNNPPTLPCKHGELSLKKMTVTFTYCGSSNVDSPIKGTASNFCVNRNGSGSNPENNGKNGKFFRKRKETYFRKKVRGQKRKKLVDDVDFGDTP